MLLTLTSNPLFGLILTIAVFLFFKEIERHYPHPLISPLLLSIVAIMLILWLTKIPYEHYFKGGQFIDMMISPATVALAIPLYRSIHLLKKHFKSILIGITIGSVFNIGLTFLFAVMFKLDKTLIASLIPESVTTAIALDISKQIGGISAITVLAVIVTGNLGPLLGPTLMKIGRIDDEVAQGLALGTTAHAIGTGKAMEMGEVQGAMSGLAIVIAGIVTVIVAPLFMLFLN